MALDWCDHANICDYILKTGTVMVTVIHHQHISSAIRNHVLIGFIGFTENPSLFSKR